jgi:hypothetical protein
MGTEHGGGVSFRPAAASGVEVEDVELRDSAGRTSAVFRSGTSLRVLVGLRATRPVESPRLALEVRGGHGTRVFRATTSVELSHEGTAELAFDIADLVLLSGDYDLSLGAIDGAGEPPLQRTVRFSVAADPAIEGVVDLRGTWRQMTREEA